MGGWVQPASRVAIKAIEELTTTIEELTAKSERLSGEIATLKDDIAKAQDALNKASLPLRSLRPMFSASNILLQFWTLERCRSMLETYYSINIWLHKSASIQPRTSFQKLGR